MIMLLVDEWAERNGDIAADLPTSPDVSNPQESLFS